MNHGRIEMSPDQTDGRGDRADEDHPRVQVEVLIERHSLDRLPVGWRPLDHVMSIPGVAWDLVGTNHVRHQDPE